MATKRIKDITTTATSTADDDYFAIDGATNGTRKIAASGISQITDVQIENGSSIDNPSVVTNGIATIPLMEGCTSSEGSKPGLVPPSDPEDNYHLLGADGVFHWISLRLDESDIILEADYESEYSTITLPVATTSANGLMSSTDKTKLDSLGAEQWNGKAYGTTYTTFSKTGEANGYQLVLANASDATTYNAMRIKAYYEDESTSYGWKYPLIITGFYVNVTNGIIRVKVKSIEALSDATTAPSYFASGKVHFYTPFEISEVLIDH